MHKVIDLLQKKVNIPLDYYTSVRLISDHWSEIVGTLSQFIEPKNIYKNKLVIICRDSSWVSEIDYFKETIIKKCNQCLIDHHNTICLVGVIAKIGEIQMHQKIKKKPVLSNLSFEDRIHRSIQSKKDLGLTLCQKCQKVWDEGPVCRICELTGGAQFETL